MYLLLLSLAAQLSVNATYALIASSYGVSIYALQYDGAYGYLGVVGYSRSGRFGGILITNGSIFVGIYEGIIGDRFLGNFRAVALLKPAPLPTSARPGSVGDVGAFVKSPVPVVLRYMVFNKYDMNGTLINDLGGVSVLSTEPPFTVTLASGADCKEYTIEVNFTKPTTNLPMPYVINTQPPLGLVTANITVTYTDPPTQVELVEPGDLLFTVDPVDRAVFNVTICRITREPTRGPGVFAAEYLGSAGFEVPRDLIDRLNLDTSNTYMLADSLLRKLASFGISNQGYHSPITILTEGLGTPVDYAALSMYILRLEGVPSRISLGLMGRPLGTSYYWFEPSDAIPWVEAYLPSGWVGFMPLPTGGGYIVGSTVLSTVGFSLLVGLVVSLPWIIGYYLYLYISRRR